MAGACCHDANNCHGVLLFSCMKNLTSPQLGLEAIKLGAALKRKDTFISRTCKICGVPHKSRLQAQGGIWPNPANETLFLFLFKPLQNHIRVGSEERFGPMKGGLRGAERGKRPEKADKRQHFSCNRVPFSEGKDGFSRVSERDTLLARNGACRGSYRAAAGLHGASNSETPSQKMPTPMHSRMNDDRRRNTSVPVSPSRLTMREA